MIQTLFPPTVDPQKYLEAVSLRTKANSTNDPAAWEEAAQSFFAIGMDAAAVDCQIRADHYRLQQ
jgi:hypothetical protein